MTRRRGRRQGWLSGGLSGWRCCRTLCSDKVQSGEDHNHGACESTTAALVALPSPHTGSGNWCNCGVSMLRIKQHISSHAVSLARTHCTGPSTHPANGSRQHCHLHELTEAVYRTTHHVSTTEWKKERQSLGKRTLELVAMQPKRKVQS